MQVRETQPAVEGPVGGDGLPARARARPHVEDDGVVAVGLERDARRVAAVPLVLVARARCRSPHTMERELDPPAHPWRIPTTGARTNYAPAPSAQDPLLEPFDPQVEEQGREYREHQIRND